MFEELAKEKMQKIIDLFSAELKKVRTGRATVSLYEDIVVSLYGTPTALKNCCKLHIEGGNCVVIVPYQRQNTQMVEKAIVDSGIGITPNVNGDQIRMINPALTEERRKELVKMVKATSEQYRVQLRAIRRDILATVKKEEKNKKITKDEVHSFESKIQSILDSFIGDIDSILENKIKSLLSISK